MGALGDRMKRYEQVYTNNRLLERCPVVVRLDGKNFSTWCRSLSTPFCGLLSDAMISVTRLLMEETNAVWGYTQSDEISLLIYSDNPKSDLLFDGKTCKFNSVLSSMCTAFFNDNDLVKSFDKRSAFFDSRSFNMPTKLEVFNYFLWRQQDALRNSVSMAAQSVYSHKELHKKGSSEMKRMLLDKGIVWGDYPAFFRMGTFLKKEVCLKGFTVEEIERLPDSHAAKYDSGFVFNRQVIEVVDLPVLSGVVDKGGVFL